MPILYILQKRPLQNLLMLAMCISAYPCRADAGKLLHGGSISATELAAIVENCKTNMPTLWEAMTDVRNQQVDITLTDENIKGPGKASGKSRITLNSRFLTGKLPAFPEDRLVIVLYHELGHLVLNRQMSQRDRDPVKHEHFAFSYSLKKAKAFAGQGNPGPLQQVIQNLTQRSEKGKPQDPHNKAIKQLMREELWSECCQILETVKSE